MKIWRTIPLGLYETCAEYRAAMKKFIYVHSHNGKSDYITRVDLDTCEAPIHPRGTTIDLVVVTPRLLQRAWDDDRAREYGIMFQLARSKGLTPCPHETALALRLLYTNQPAREHLTVATEDMRLCEKQARVFSVCADDEGTPHIMTSEGWPSSVAMSPESKIVFTRPRR